MLENQVISFAEGDVAAPATFTFPPYMAPTLRAGPSSACPSQAFPVPPPFVAHLHLTGYCRLPCLDGAGREDSDPLLLPPSSVAGLQHRHNNSRVGCLSLEVAIVHLRFPELCDKPDGSPAGLMGSRVGEEGKRRCMPTEHLYSPGNELAELPAAIGILTALRDLDLGRNHLHTVPPQLGDLTELLTLNLMCNKLSSLPPEIGQLRRLQRLGLKSNCLEELPPEIGGLEVWSPRALLFPPSLVIHFFNSLLPALSTASASPHSGNSLSPLILLSSPPAYSLCDPPLSPTSPLPWEPVHPWCPSRGLLTTCQFSWMPHLAEQSLQELFLSDNRLRFLPAEFGQMRSLVRAQNSYPVKLPLDVQG